jgi:microcystin-dependent protein
MFNVPDLRGRAPIQWGKGVGLSGYEIGKQAGAEQVTLSVPQLPAHNHAVNAITVGNQPLPANNYFGALPVDPGTGVGSNNWASGTPNAVMNAGTISPTGNNQPVTIISPILAITYIIAWEGIYPSRP